MDWEAKRCLEEDRRGRDWGPRNANIRGSDGVDQKLGGGADTSPTETRRVYVLMGEFGGEG